MTLLEESIYREGFEAAFKLLSEYVENGLDMETARINAEKIMYVKQNASNGRFLPSSKPSLNPKPKPKAKTKASKKP
tara:strand:+ start:176 stop:406 length:231 start_codon:yes stop_codon:yes gene_type:complete